MPTYTQMKAALKALARGATTSAFDEAAERHRQVSELERAGIDQKHRAIAHAKLDVIEARHYAEKLANQPLPTPSSDDERQRHLAYSLMKAGPGVYSAWKRGVAARLTALWNAGWIR